MKGNLWNTVKKIGKVSLKILNVTADVLEVIQESDKDRQLNDLKKGIIYTLLRHAQFHGQHAYMRSSDIGRDIGTYRREYQSRKYDPFSRKHHELLRELEYEGRVEHYKRVGWRLTEREYNRLN